MLTHNQISLTRKALYGIMLLGVFLSAFGGGNLPSVRAQEAGTESPTVYPGIKSPQRSGWLIL